MADKKRKNTVDEPGSKMKKKIKATML